MRQRALLLFLLLSPALAVAQPEDDSAPERDWFTIETRHFTVSYHDGAERTGRAIAKIAEEVYGPITSLYGHQPDSKVAFVVKDLSDYSNGAAYFFNNKIEIWASPLDFELRGTHNWLRNVISHEFTHIIQMQASMKWGRGIPALTFQWFGYERERRSDVLYGYPNLLVSYPLPGIIVPPWMAEGTAQYNRAQFGYEHWDAHRDMILRCYVLSDSLLSWGEMSAFGKTSLGNESVYNAGYNLTRYIARTYGEKAIVDITRAMAKPFVFTVDAAIKDVLGIPGRQIYDEWAAALRSEYAARIAPVLQRRAEGEIIAGVGFANLSPAFSPDRRRLAYVSNKTSDYFGQSSLYLYDLATGKETMLAPAVHSALSWSPDGASLYYSKYNTATVRGHLSYDLYRCDIATGEETRVTEGLRAYNPAVSPDGARIAFVHAHDGNVNLGIVAADGSGFRPVTAFTHGEQVFTPRWSPDGARLIFGYSARAQRSIATVAADGSDFRVVLADAQFDYRDPQYSADGGAVYYACDRTGIFNIYRRDLATGREEQLTNVVGGAFMPAVGDSGSIACALYTASGYKLALMRHAAALEGSANAYLPPREMSPPVASADEAAWNWTALRDFDDSTLPDAKSKSYARIFQRLMFFPTLRIDQYNPDNTGLSLLKPGLMLYSSDMLNRLDLMASASINTRLERDLFLAVTYRDALPLLSSLGVYPALSLEAYNVSRKTTSSIPFAFDTVGVDVGFNLLEFAAHLRHNIIDNHSSIDIGYRHSRYTSTIGSFRNPESDRLNAAFDNLYFVGNDISCAFRLTDLLPARDGEINPTGLRFALHYDFESNSFNSNGDYGVDPSTGMLVPRYTDFVFHRLESQLWYGMQLPGWQHALSLRLRAGSILGPPVDEFFNFYAGGITGMQGYTYYALGGNELYAATITYRFPILPSMDLRIGHMLFDKLYGGLFCDVGDAQPRPDMFTVRGAVQDAGFELRLEAFSFSMYPTRIFFSGAYGLTRFRRSFQLHEVEYGREWRWYLGVLFGFDLSDGFTWR